MMKDEITVSICMITYNHAKFITQAIEGVLMQELDFKYELIISDDCSTDQTQEICQNYQTRYPTQIRYIRHEKNVGMNANFITTLQACNGKYIALCEGDDYWVAPNKLQTQVTFLEQNPDYSICFHRAKLLYEQPGVAAYPDINVSTPSTTSIIDLTKGNYIHTPTCIFRNQYLEFPDWMYQAFPPDWVLHLLNAQFGKIGFLEHEFSVYRIHSGGVLSTQNKNKYADAILDTLLHLQSFFYNIQPVQAAFIRAHARYSAYFKGVENIHSDSRYSRFKIMLNYAYRYNVLTYFLLSFLVLIVPFRILGLYQNLSKRL